MTCTLYTENIKILLFYFVSFRLIAISATKQEINFSSMCLCVPIFVLFVNVHKSNTKVRLQKNDYFSRTSS